MEEETKFHQMWRAPSMGSPPNSTRRDWVVARIEMRSPVEFPHPSLFAEAVLAPGAVLPLDPDYDERAVYVASGEIDIAGDSFGEGRLLVFKPGDRISILATAQSRLVLLGGEPMDSSRHIWWNFVSSSMDRISQAKEDWRAKRFGLVPGDEKEFIPLPE